jgi:hypothetical protein
VLSGGINPPPDVMKQIEADLNEFKRKYAEPHTDDKEA